MTLELNMLTDVQYQEKKIKTDLKDKKAENRIKV